MRLSFITLFLSCLSLVSFASASASASAKPKHLSRHVTSQRSPMPNVLSSRQYRVTRDLLDVCINVNVDLLADALQLLGLGALLGALDLDTTIHLCLCLKDLDIYLDTNDDIQALVGLVGRDPIEAMIKALINTSPDAAQCVFPPNAHHTCNDSDPCHYQCDEHYIRDGGSCVCAPPYISCNGVCDLFPQGCSSAVPRTLKARSAPIATLSQARATCKSHETVCGISGVDNSLAFECLDTSSKSDSCGGCMVPHPFFEEEPVHQSSGQDCTSILNVKAVGCSAKRCVVQSCKAGFVPNLDQSECVLEPSVPTRMSRVAKRSEPLSANANADASIDSDLLTQLIDIVDMVLNINALLPSSPTATPAYSSPISLDSLSSLVDGINTATDNLINSSTVGGLEAYLGDLLDKSLSLSSFFGKCGCADDLGLSDLVQETDSLIYALLNTQTWCGHNPVVSGPTPSPSGVGHPTPIPTTSAPDQPIIVGLSDLLTGLGLKGKSGVVISGLLGGGLTNTVNNLLNSLNLGPNNYRRRTPSPSAATIDPELSDKITALVTLVVNLNHEASALPSPAVHSPSLPSTSDLLKNILQITANIVNSPTDSYLVTALGDLAGYCTNALQLFDSCGCADNLGLQPLVADVDAVLNAALDAQSWCHGHAVVPGSPAAPTAPKPPSMASPGTGGIPIVVGLSDLLSGLGLLGPVKSSATVAGLGSELNDPVNDLLDSLDLGPLNARRDTTSASTIGTQIQVLVDLGTKLQQSLDSVPPSTSASCVGSLDAALTKDILDPVASISHSPSTSTILLAVDRILAADSALQGILGKCSCTDGLEDVIDYLVQITEMALELKGTCGGPHSSTGVPHPVSTSHSTGVPHVVSTSHSTASASSQHQQTSSHLSVAHSSTAVVSHSSAHTYTATTLTVSIGVPTATHIPTTLHSTIAPLPVRPTLSHASPSYPPSHTQTPSTSPASQDEIILALNQLLASLGLSGVKGVVTVGGLGQGLTDSVNQLLNGLGLGPNGLRRRGNRKGMKRADAAVMSSLQTKIAILIDLALGFNNASSSLPAVQPPSVHPASDRSLPAIDSSFGHGIMNATAALLTSTTYPQLVDGIVALVLASGNSLKALEGCGCVDYLGLDSLYHYVSKIADLALSLEDSYPPGSSAPPPTHPSSTVPSSDSDEPLVVGLSTLLDVLGLPGKSGIVVGGLLGNDHSLNQLLDGLSIGPSDYRRRTTYAKDE